MPRRIFIFAVCLFLSFESARAVDVPLYHVLELSFTSSTAVNNPFDEYLLKLEVTDPSGNTFQVEGFYDGDGMGGQAGDVWRARLNPYAAGTWSWRTVPGDAPAPDLEGLSGRFEVTPSSERGGIVADGRYFQFQDGTPVYLGGIFTDLIGGPPTTTFSYFGDNTTDADRATVMARQQFHDANKANIMFAQAIARNPMTPWLGTWDNSDKTQMNLARWNGYDEYIRQFNSAGMVAELWYFSDESGFGNLPLEDLQRLIRYGMARTSALNTMYVTALEWQEGFTGQKVNQMGDFLDAHNPWRRLASVHGLPGTGFPFSGWATFAATQAGFNRPPGQINEYVQFIRGLTDVPHIEEEFGLLFGDSDPAQRSGLWAVLTGGAAGSGSGSDLAAMQSFLASSRMPFQRMQPDNGLVSDGGNLRFALAEKDHHYLVYSVNGSFDLDLSGDGLMAQWFNPRDANGTLTDAVAVAPGTVRFTPPATPDQDWVLWVSDGTNLNPGVTHPTRDASLIPVEVFQDAMPGDANRDRQFDQLDIIAVLAAAKYLTGLSASWSEGDWNNDGLFDQRDVIAALSTGFYLTGPYAGLSAADADEDSRASVIYNAATGEVAVQAPAADALASVEIQSAAAIFTGSSSSAEAFRGSLELNGNGSMIRAAFDDTVGAVSFGNIVPAGLGEQFLLGDLTVSGSLAGGGSLGVVDLIYVAVPEPASLLLLIAASVMLGGWATFKASTGSYRRKSIVSHTTG